MHMYNVYVYTEIQRTQLNIVRHYLPPAQAAQIQLQTPDSCRKGSTHYDLSNLSRIYGVGLYLWDDRYCLECWITMSQTLPTHFHVFPTSVLTQTPEKQNTLGMLPKPKEKTNFCGDWGGSLGQL